MVDGSQALGNGNSTSDDLILDTAIPGDKTLPPIVVALVTMKISNSHAHSVLSRTTPLLGYRIPGWKFPPEKEILYHTQMDLKQRSTRDDNNSTWL